MIIDKLLDLLFEASILFESISRIFSASLVFAGKQEVYHCQDKDQYEDFYEWREVGHNFKVNKYCGAKCLGCR